MKKDKSKNKFTREELEKMKEQDELEYQAFLLDKRIQDRKEREKRGELTEVEKYINQLFDF